jgi:hypothetical protein
MFLCCVCFRFIFFVVFVFFGSTPHHTKNKKRYIGRISGKLGGRISGIIVIISISSTIIIISIIIGIIIITSTITINISSNVTITYVYIYIYIYIYIYRAVEFQAFVEVSDSLLECMPCWPRCFRVHS